MDTAPADTDASEADEALLLAMLDNPHLAHQLAGLGDDTPDTDVWDHE